MLSVISRNFVGIVCVSSLLIAAPLSAADAADIPTKAPPPVAPGTAWTSCYINGGAGYGMWTQQHTDLTTFGGVPGTTISQTDGGNGWLGRFGGGCDYQIAPRWVIGAFGDYDLMNLAGTNSPLEEVGGIPVSATANSWERGTSVSAPAIC